MPRKVIISYSPHNNVYLQKLILIYQLCTITMIIFSVSWLVIFAVRDLKVLAGFEAFILLISGVSLIMIRRGFLTYGGLLAQSSMLGLVVFFCLIFDHATITAPRVTHIFLLVLAMIGYLHHRAAPGRIQIGIVGIAIGAFIYFSGSTFVPSFAQPLDDEFRCYKVWIAIIVAVGMLCGSASLMKHAVKAPDAVTKELQIALTKGQFEIFLQSQTDSVCKVIGAEVLLRWNHPIRGYISPMQFIPAAEVAGMMPEIGRWVLVQTSIILSRWKNDNEKNALTLSVNISADHFLMDDFENSVQELLHMYNVNPSRLKLELTESMFVSNIDRIIQKMNCLIAAGLAVSLDDFGTGYSSLNYLQRLPLNQLKIDRSFVSAALACDRGAAVAKTIIKLGKTLHLEILAEGIEKVEQWEFFRRNGCTAFQGYLFGRAMPVEDFENKLLSPQMVCPPKNVMGVR